MAGRPVRRVGDRPIRRRDGPPNDPVWRHPAVAEAGRAQHI